MNALISQLTAPTFTHGLLAAGAIATADLFVSDYFGKESKIRDLFKVAITALTAYLAVATNHQSLAMSLGVFTLSSMISKFIVWCAAPSNGSRAYPEIRDNGYDDPLQHNPESGIELTSILRNNNKAARVESFKNRTGLIFDKAPKALLVAGALASIFLSIQKGASPFDMAGTGYSAALIIRSMLV